MRIAVLRAVTEIRKTLRLAAFLIVLALSASAVSPAASQKKTGRSFALPNGLRVFLYEKHDLPLLNMAISVNAGVKNETPETNGLAHLLEHCLLFRGTEFRSGGEVGRDIRRHGAYFNASTGPDLFLFEISLPSQYADFALRNQREILFDFAPAPEELEAEKAVILEEISQARDDPRRHGMDLVLERLFKGHPYGKPVAGSEPVIRSATVEALKAFHDRYFVPDNCAVAVVGDFISGEMEQKIRSLFGPLKRGSAAPPPLAKVPLLKKSVTVEEERDVREAYLFIGFVAPDCNAPDQYAMDLLTEVMGRGVNPILSAVLTSRRRLVQTLGMSYLANLYGGAVVISMTLAPKDVPAALRESVAYLRKSGGESYSRDDFAGSDRYEVFDFLGSAKNQIRFSAEQAEESGLGLASSLARFMLLNTRENPGRFLEHIARTSSADLRKAASLYFGRGDYVAVAIVPRNGDHEDKEERERP
jgi:zinc protease